MFNEKITICNGKITIFNGKITNFHRKITMFNGKIIMMFNRKIAMFNGKIIMMFKRKITIFNGKITISNVRFFFLMVVSQFLMGNPYKLYNSFIVHLPIKNIKNSDLPVRKLLIYQRVIQMFDWLVVWNIFVLFHSVGKNHPN